MKTGAIKYLLINTGNANAGTGDVGLNDTHKICSELAVLTGVTPSSILPFSTGVTMELIPVDPIVNNLGNLIDNLNSDGWEDAALGIMTTDTVPKSATVNFTCLGETVTISGITKGSGMIKPNMATMLSFIATDAKIEASVLDDMLNRAVSKSFNRITVDGDTSTNDSCILIATGKSVSLDNRELQDTFYSHLVDLMQLLAQNMVRDAEGATKFITITVKGGASANDCLEIGRASCRERV